MGGWAGAVVSGDLDPTDRTAAKGFANAVGELKEVTTKGGMLSAAAFILSLAIV